MADKKEIVPKSGEKKSLKDITIPNWLAVVIIASIAVIVLGVIFVPKMFKSNELQATGTTFSSEASPDAVNVEVLPQKNRVFSDGEEITNPFATENFKEVKLTGIIKNSSGKATAIIQTINNSFIVNEGDKIPDSTWEVAEIGDDYITFKFQSSTKTIRISSND